MACVGRWIVGVIAAWLLGIAPALAASTALHVDAFDVEQVASLDPGTTLQFSVFATPGASATVMVDGVRRLVELREVEPGIYEGRHVIEGADRIGPGSTAVATVWRNGSVVRATLEESLLLDGAPPVLAAPAPVPSTVPEGEPAPMPRAVPPQAPAVERAPAPYHAGSAFPAPAPTHAMPVPPAERQAECRNCAVVEAIRAVEVPTGPAYAGAIAGGIFGAVFGDQVGKAHERHVTRVLGAIGGAILGHEIQRAATSRTVYDATLRMPNGSLRVRRYDALPPFQVGQRIPVGGGMTARAPTL